MASKIITVDKFPDEDRVYGFDFTLQSEIVAGAIIVGATVTCSTTGLTIGSPQIGSGGKTVYAEISGGLANEHYLLECVGTTDTSLMLVVYGKLRLLDPARL